MNGESITVGMQRLNANEANAAELTQVALKNAKDPLKEGHKVFTKLYETWAMHLAELSDHSRSVGIIRSPIEGLTVSIKDLFDVAGEVTTAGSVVLKEAPPAKEHAEVVANLLRSGAIVIGKTNMTEFAYSGLGINPHYGTPANPSFKDEKRIPGGSSSGAAVSVATGMAHAGIGSDTGGSIRIPAAYCGLTGFKPTASRVSTKGVLPLSEALDSIGVIAHDVISCAYVDGVISGKPLPLTWASLRFARFAVPQTVVLDDMDEHVAITFEAVINSLKQHGATVEYIALPEFSELATINEKGGYNAAEAWTWHQELLQTRYNEYDPRVASRIYRGEKMLASDFIQLGKARKTWQEKVNMRIAGYDALLMPTVSTIAPKIADLQADESLYFSANGKALRNSTFINFLDGCAISVPCHEKNTAPVGLMIAGSNMQDAAILRWSLVIEQMLAGIGSDQFKDMTESYMKSHSKY